MTLFGWDASHYDGVLTRDIMARAKREGIAFFTHKIGEGYINDDPLDGTCLAAARDVGIQFLGGYFIPHQGQDPARLVTRCIQLADKDEPWWRNFPGWFWQCDAERWATGDQVTPREIKAFCDDLHKRTGKLVICYASRGMYANTLQGLGHPLWNAAYGTNPVGQFKSIYPGDSGTGWRAYSGQTPVFWQYGSRATIAGLTTCDANAFRGSMEDLEYLITQGGSVPLTPEDLKNIKEIVWHSDIDTGDRVMSGGTALLASYDRLTTVLSKLDQIINSIETSEPGTGPSLTEVKESLAEVLRLGTNAFPAG
jgi:hypothetical protein